jgi:hypothetical protein
VYDSTRSTVSNVVTSVALSESVLTGAETGTEPEATGRPEEPDVQMTVR